MADDFNLHSLVAQVCAESDVVNVEKLAFDVAARIDPADWEEAFQQALIMAVRTIVTKLRNKTAIRADQADQGDGATVRPITPRAGRSWKRDGIRDYWRKALTETYSIDRRGNSVALADLNRAQVLFNITAREETARCSAAKALQLRGLLDLMVRHDVDRVRDLPESVLASILVRAA